jgi:hypothetical protein
MRSLSYASILLLAVVPGACSSAKPAPTQSTLTLAGSPSRDLVALSGIDKLARLTARSRATSLGFVAPQQVQAASLGTGVPMYSMDRALLASFSATMDPHGVLAEEHRTFYPVIANGQAGSRAASSVIVAQRNDGAWDVTEIGRMNLAHSIEQAQSATVSKHGPTIFALVESPSASLRFLAFDEGGQLWLTPLGDVSGTSLVAGQPVEAAQALGELAPLAATL